MFNRVKDQESPVSLFRHEGCHYDHVIFYDDDDRVECRVHPDLEVMITYYADCYVYKGKNEKLLGRTSIDSSNNWIYTDDETNETIKLGRGLLEGEVLVSKHYLSKWQKEKDAASSFPVPTSL